MKNQYLAKRQKTLTAGVKYKGVLIIHKSVVRNLKDQELKFLIATTKSLLPKGFKYDILRVDKLNEMVSFIKITNFDEDPDPIFEKCFVSRINGAVREYCPNHKHVYHHKWIYVTDRYAGFNVTASKNWSEQWMNAPELKEYKKELGKEFEKRCEDYYFWTGKILKLISSPLNPLNQIPV